MEFETAVSKSKTTASDSEIAVWECEAAVSGTKFNLHSILCGHELGKNVKKIPKIVETFPHGPLIRGVYKEFIISKIA